MHIHHKSSEILDKVVANMRNCNLPVSLLDAKQLKDPCPYLNLPDDFAGAFEEDGGILAASKAVAALQVVYITVGMCTVLIYVFIIQCSVVARIHTILVQNCDGKNSNQ